MVGESRGEEEEKGGEEKAAERGRGWVIEKMKQEEGK